MKPNGDARKYEESVQEGRKAEGWMNEQKYGNCALTEVLNVQLEKANNTENEKRPLTKLQILQNLTILQCPVLRTKKNFQVNSSIIYTQIESHSQLTMPFVIP